MPERLNTNIPTWTELNRILRNIHSEENALKLLQELHKFDASPRWIKRVSARYRRLRYLREQADFEQGKMPYKGPRTPKDTRRKVGESELGRAVGFEFADEVNVTTLTDKRK